MEYRDFVRMKNLIVSGGSQAQAANIIKDYWKAAARWAAGNILLKNYPDFESIDTLKETSSFSAFLDRTCMLSPFDEGTTLVTLKNSYGIGMDLLKGDPSIEGMIEEIEKINVNDFLKPALKFDDKYLTSSLTKIGVDCNITENKMVFKFFDREIIIDYEYKDNKFYISRASDNYEGTENFAGLQGETLGIKELRSILNYVLDTNYYLKKI